MAEASGETTELLDQAKALVHADSSRLVMSPKEACGRVHDLVVTKADEEVVVYCMRCAHYFYRGVDITRER